MRSTKIVCTLGPSTADARGILRLMDEGMDIARINFSHGDREQHRKTVRLIRALNRKRGYSVATLLDTKGSEIRTGDVGQPIVVREGDLVVFSSKQLPREKLQVIHVNYDGFAHDVRKAEHILLDNGEMTFALRQIRRDGSVVAQALDAGSIGSRRHVNLPGADIGLPSITAADWKDIAVGIAEGMDFVGLSFIRTKDDIRSVREFLARRKSSMQIIAKIETRQAVDDLDGIIEASDGIMVARGDLGAEIAFERIPAIQDDIVRRCRSAGKPVIVATHMLESMIGHPMPTRAEVTDVAHAAWTQADATMLSGETAMGKHPFQALSAMSRILQETESHFDHVPAAADVPIVGELEARAESAVTLASFIGAPAILAFTRSGRTVQAISKFRPRMPILAFTPDEVVLRRLQLSFGARPFHLPFQKDPERTLTQALKLVAKQKLVVPGQRVVIVSDALGAHGSVSTIQVRPTSARGA
jgi:pyruvate kinase